MISRSIHSVHNIFTFIFLTIVCAFSPAFGEESPVQPSFQCGESSFALELQAYWTGVITSISFEHFVSDRDTWHVRLSGQRIRHEDYGEHDDERGDGFGGTLGYRRYWPNGLSLGARVDLWQNALDWTDNRGLAAERRGQTDVTVVQPVLEVTWRKPLFSTWFIQPSVAMGAEINVKTSGEDTGEGLIWLVGVGLGRYVHEKHTYQRVADRNTLNPPIWRIGVNLSKCRFVGASLASSVMIVGCFSVHLLGMPDPHRTDYYTQTRNTDDEPSTGASHSSSLSLSGVHNGTEGVRDVYVNNVVLQMLTSNGPYDFAVGTVVVKRSCFHTIDFSRQRIDLQTQIFL